MEGTPLSTRSDPENDYSTKKSKDKRKRFESMSEDTAISLRQSRHIAREALRHEEKAAETSTNRIDVAENSAKLIAHRDFEYRQRAPEAKQLHGEAESPEHIGHVLIAAEAPKRHKENASATSTQERLQLPPNKRIETLSRPELLALSQQIIIEGASLRHIYETHLIGEQALRRLIAEYLHGGDIQRSLQHEIVEHEIDFERDPALRGLSIPTDSDNSDSQKVTAPAKETLNQLLQKAGDRIFASDEGVTYDTTTSDHKTEHAIQQRQLGRPIDVIMALIIVALIILVVALYFWHH